MGKVKSAKLASGKKTAMLRGCPKCQTAMLPTQSRENGHAKMMQLCPNKKCGYRISAAEARRRHLPVLAVAAK